MNKELYHLLEDYKGSELDKDFIDESFNIMMSDEDTLRDKFVQSLVFDDKIKSIGNYSFEDKRISVNIENVRQAAMRKQYYNEKLFALGTLRHELEHAREVKKLFEYRTDIESTVTGYSLRGFCIGHGFMCPMIPEYEEYNSVIDEDNYLFSPAERISDIKAWKYIVNLIKNQKGTEDLLYARSMLYYSYVRGYKDNRYYLDAPTYTYLLNQRMFNNFKYLKRRVGEKDYSLDTRILCGLPITYKEYERTILHKLGLQLSRR